VVGCKTDNFPVGAVVCGCAVVAIALTQVIRQFGSYIAIKIIDSCALNAGLAVCPRLSIKILKQTMFVVVGAGECRGVSVRLMCNKNVWANEAREETTGFR